MYVNITVANIKWIRYTAIIIRVIYYYYSGTHWVSGHGLLLLLLILYE